MCIRDRYYNSSLIGVNGREYGYLDDEANLEGVVKPATNGKTIVSTVDVNVQNILQKYVNEWQTTVGSKITAAIAMDPNSGEILGMATSNVFDRNKPRDVSGDTEEELLALGKKEAAAVYRSCLLYTSSEVKKTLPVGIGQLNGYYRTEWNEMMAACFISALPVVITFIFLQKYFIASLTAGAVKE